MRRFLFWLLMMATIAFSVYVILFQEFFWHINASGNAGEDVSIIGGEAGWDIVFEFFRDIGNFNWGTEAGHFLIYGLVLFCVMTALAVISLTFTLIFNMGMLGRSKRLYRIAPWFLVAMLIFLGLFIWNVFEFISSTNGSWSIRVFNPWFYIPIGLSLSMVILGAIIYSSETKTD